LAEFGYLSIDTELLLFKTLDGGASGHSFGFTPLTGRIRFSRRSSSGR
jgi:hypothetical protein